MARRRTLLAIIVATAAAFPAAALAAPGDLTYRSCLTGEGESAASCAAISSSVLGGIGSGLDRLESIAVSPDGRSVYVAAGADDDAVARFDRDPATGALAYAGCLTGRLTNTACTAISGATADGTESGLDWPESVAVSPDGRSVYLTSRMDDAIAQFGRDPVTGALAYVGCDSSEDESVGPCDAIGATTPGGVNSGFDDPKIKASVFSADGRFVYAAGSQDHSIVRFSRDTATGALSFLSCLTGEDNSSPPCTDVPNATLTGINSGVSDPRWLLMGPDDRSLYSVSNNDDAIARFSRDPETGALTFAACITGDTNVGPAGSGACGQIPSATVTGSDSGFASPRAMAVSADGEFAYAVGANDAAVLSFDRDPATGGLSYLGCLTGEEASGPAGTGACALLPTATAPPIRSGFDLMRSMAISADGLSLYTSAQGNDAVATFDRDPATGTLAFDRCVTGDLDVACTALPGANPGGEDSGVDDLETIALSADGRSLYGASEFDDAVSHFDREPIPVPTGTCQGATVPKIDGTDGNDTLTGSGTGDLISGLGGKDTLDGGGGKDCVFGNGGKDTVKGGAGSDQVDGGSGEDSVKGNGGKDTVKGQGGKDSLKGGGGKDQLKGGRGSDTIKPGGGKDRVNCGRGRDKVTASAADKISKNCERVTIKP